MAGERPVLSQVRDARGRTAEGRTDTGDRRYIHKKRERERGDWKSGGDRENLKKDKGEWERQEGSDRERREKLEREREREREKRERERERRERERVGQI